MDGGRAVSPGRPLTDCWPRRQPTTHAVRSACARTLTHAPSTSGACLCVERAYCSRARAHRQLHRKPLPAQQQPLVTVGIAAVCTALSRALNTESAQPPPPRVTKNMASKLRTGMVKAAAAGGASLEAFMHGDGWKSGAGELPATIAQSLSSEQARTLCTALCAIIASATDVMRGASGENLMAAAGAGVEDAGEEAAQSRAMNSVATIVSFMGAWAARAETPLPDAAFGRVMEALHMLIIDLPETKQGLALRTSIARLCETMWTQKRPFRNDIVGISLPVLIDDSLHPEAKDVNVRHVWAVREALDLIDFANEDSRGLAGAILTCYLRPLYTRTAENRRFLSYVMVHVPTLLPRIQEVVKAQLPYQPRLSDCFADVYFKAWQQAPDVSARTAIEQVCIQDLLHRGMHAQAPETFKSVTRFVHELVEHKKSKDVDAMLLRCMEPIIFRALQSANALVRKQAAIVFFDCFPLRDPDLPARDLEALLQRQFDAISALMQDASPAVREVAVKGVARVLNL
ncbi:hypothetical protein EON66_06940, partial [archaeon]